MFIWCWIYANIPPNEIGFASNFAKVSDWNQSRAATLPYCWKTSSLQCENNEAEVWKTYSDNNSLRLCCIQSTIRECSLNSRFLGKNVRSRCYLRCESVVCTVYHYSSGENEIFRVYCVYENNIPWAKWKILCCLQTKSSFSEWKIFVQKKKNVLYEKKKLLFETKTKVGISI